jgi:hypothetical protein
MGTFQVTLVAISPVGLISALPLAVLGYIAFAEAVWNTPRLFTFDSSADL